MSAASPADYSQGLYGMGKRFNRKDRPAVLHFLTLNVRERKRAFSQDEYARASLAVLRQHCNNHPARLIAYVLMPTHLHCVINPKDGGVTRFLTSYKPAVTSAVKKIATDLGHESVLGWLRREDGTYQLWQEGKHDEYLYSPHIISQKIEYIHNNPVRAGLVEYVDQYLYSSFSAMHFPSQENIIPIDTEYWWNEE